MRQGAWPRKSAGIKEGLLGEVAQPLDLENSKAKAKRWEGRAGTGTPGAVWWGSPPNQCFV